MQVTQYTVGVTFMRCCTDYKVALGNQFLSISQSFLLHANAHKLQKNAKTKEEKHHRYNYCFNYKKRGNQHIVMSYTISTKTAM